MNYIQIVCVFLVLMLVMKIYYLWKTAPKKNFISSKPTNILITGGVQGIGKLLAAKFATMHPNGEVNLIVIDIAENLAADMKRDINSKFKQPNMNRIHFYKANLADAASINLLWQQIVRDHGPIHLLVNNAARALGRKVDELTLEQVKLTMDINFHSYVQLMMLFLKQKEIQLAQAHQFQIVNVISIAGHMTCQRNSDYCASKFALTGFVDALRQEM